MGLGLGHGLGYRCWCIMNVSYNYTRKYIGNISHQHIMYICNISKPMKSVLRRTIINLNLVQFNNPNQCIICSSILHRSIHTTTHQLLTPITTSIQPQTANDDDELERLLMVNNDSGTTNASAYTNNNSHRHDEEIAPLRHTILNTALEYIKQDGFTQDAVRHSILHHNYSTSLLGIFHNPTMSLIEYYIKHNELLMTQHLLQVPLETMNMSARIQYSIKYRLSLNIPYLQQWTSACSVCIEPLNISSTMRLYGELIDEIWHVCGDRASDMNWYLRRGALSIIYCNTELYMLTDRSHQYNDTWIFLQRQMDMLQAITPIRKVTIDNTKIGMQLFSAFVNDGIKQLYQRLPNTSQFSSINQQQTNHAKPT